METIREFFTKNPLGRTSIERKHLRGIERFQKWLPEECDRIWPCTLAYFVLHPPLTYWDDDVVDLALGILEKNIERTANALEYRDIDVNNGFDNLLRVAQHYVEESLDLSRTTELLIFANEVNPQYLQIAQHTFGNLLVLFWSVIKKGGVDGKFDFTGAVAAFKRRNAELLTGGYDDTIRNSIAHGQVYFRGLGIQYGELKYPYELTSFEFFEKFDLLWRNSVSMIVAIILFYARNAKRANIKHPLYIARLLAASSVERNGLKIKDVMVSESGKTGSQLHVLLETSNFSRSAIIMDCMHYAIRLNEYGCNTFSRILFDVNYFGKSITGLLILKLSRLSELLALGAPVNHVGEILEHNLLWYDESTRLLVLRAFWGNMRETIKHEYWKFAKQVEGNIKLLPPDTYLVKEIKNSSAGGIARLDVVAVFTNPEDASRKDRIQAVTREIVKKQLSKWVSTNPSGLTKRLNLRVPPSCIWVHLYKRDGTLRSLTGSGWPGGNLVCVAEFIRGKQSPLLVKQPDIIDKGIRYQFSMKYPTRKANG